MEKEPKFVESAKEQIIKAEDKEGKPIEFNLEKIKQHWAEFYQQNNLQELKEEIERTKINLINEQTETIKEKAKEGFNHFVLLPSIETQQKHLINIKQETGKEMEGLDKKQQYSKTGTHLGGFLKSFFPDGIDTLDRPTNRPYLLFVKDMPVVEDETRKKSPSQLREIFKQKQETGLTLSEYLIFQRDYTQRYQTHPDAEDSTWLLDSEIRVHQDGAFGVPASYRHLVLNAEWGTLLHPRRVDIVENNLDDDISVDGARPSVVFEI
ncbi:MAG: hypothetical protein A2V69_02740 [Candidatus Portnoybacteria bacterium RBG_13_40_8]|uniref:Uncharacterized protein n=1 Tax=Candidatus Portnoybacteria bacterium RBG_13_40_8 TaxID=1801990 RepID=A0A1G2F586_9BACT|nr:MAG: hypothetical protein A2V69_02740 [Candidatus Portnoybacteria bacterium RBG_13_40_8]